jgi:hypothetical protein
MYPPGYYFWRFVILAGGILLMGMYSLAGAGLVYGWFHPLADLGNELSPSTILGLMILALWVFALAFIIGNRLPCKYAHTSAGNQFDPQHEAKS